MGRPVVLAPLLLYTDDTSGNRSKNYNKFDCWCFHLAGLPHQENAKLHNIHFITCSNQVPVLQMAEPIVEDLIKLESGVDAYDSHLQTDVLVVAPVLAAMGDNPRHSEILNHLGTRANKYCRVCLVRNNILIYFSLSAMYVHVIRHVKSLLYPPFGHASLQVDKNEDPTEISEIQTRELALAQMQDIASHPTETQKANKRKKME